MNNFMEASRIKLRVQTPQGPLSVEQLWGLNLSSLSTAIKEVNKSLKNNDGDELSFLDETKTVDPVAQLTFDILKEIYTIKKKEQDDAKNAASIKAHNEKIMQLIHEKQEGELKDKSIDELKAMLK
jgi:polyribonucleotide nucleotidyltransferase